jgi:excisionase family DNA binding protein
MKRSSKENGTGNEHQKLKTLKHAAGRLGISDRTLEAWVACGAVPFVRLGRRIVRFTEGNIQEIIDRGANKPLRYKEE